MKLQTFFSVLLLSAALSDATPTIRVIRGCFVTGSPFIVTVTNDAPLAGDWVDVIPKLQLTNNLTRSSGSWVFACGTRTCRSLLRSGNVTIPNIVAPGFYKAVLSRNGRGPRFSAIAVSQTVRVVAVASACAQGPVRPPVAFPPTLQPDINGAARTAMAQARTSIINIINQNRTLIPKFLRMGFTDCIGGCDGCIDLADPENNGLAFPVNALFPVVQRFANQQTGLSRADIWALAATVAVDVAEPSPSISFDMNWFGRVNCENANQVCRNANGVAVPCTAIRGPHRPGPDPNFNSQGILNFFATNFNFTRRQTVAIMGAHTIGRLGRTESGIHGPHGWTFNNEVIQNEYYKALLGTSAPLTSTSTDQDIYDNSPPWRRTFLDNSQIPGEIPGTHPPNRHFWNFQDSVLIMTNADIALIRNLSPANLNSATGLVNCAFSSGFEPTLPNCPIARSNYASILNFMTDNALWLREFKSALDLVLTNGYRRVQCNNPPCRLQK